MPAITVDTITSEQLDALQCAAAEVERVNATPTPHTFGGHQEGVAHAQA